MHGIRADDSGTDDAKAQALVDLKTDRVVDPTDHLRHVEDVLGHLRGHDVAVVTVRKGAEGVRTFDARPLQHVLVNAVAEQGIAAERIAETGERGGRLIDDRDLVVLFGELQGKAGAHPSAAEYHNLHEEWIMPEQGHPVRFEPLMRFPFTFMAVLSIALGAWIGSYVLLHPTGDPVLLGLELLPAITLVAFGGWLLYRRLAKGGLA